MEKLTSRAKRRGPVSFAAGTRGGEQPTGEGLLTRGGRVRGGRAALGESDSEDELAVTGSGDKCEAEPLSSDAEGESEGEGGPNSTARTRAKERDRLKQEHMRDWAERQLQVQGIGVEDEVTEEQTETKQSSLRKEMQELFRRRDDEKFEAFSMGGFWNSQGVFVEEGERRSGNRSSEAEDEDAEGGKDPWLEELTEEGEKPRPVDLSRLFRKAAGEEANSSSSSSSSASPPASTGEMLHTSDPFQLRSALHSFLLPSETVLQALKRLGGSKEQRMQQQMKQKLGQRQKHSQQPPQQQQEPQGDAAGVDEEERKRAFDTITEASSRLMDQGCFDVYQFTRERIANDLQRAHEQVAARRGRQREEEEPDDSSKRARVEEGAAAEGAPSLQWEYKWSDADEKVYGPFSGEQMMAWRDEGYFDKALVRRAGAGSAAWAQSSRATDFTQ